jgi:hypothetical protein
MSDVSSATPGGENVYPPGDRAPRSPEEKMKEAKTARFPLGGLLSLVGGAAILVGSFLVWIELSTPGIGFQGGRVGGTTKALDLTLGIVAMIGGGLVILGALLWTARRSVGRFFGTIVLLGAIGAAAVGVYVLLTLQSRFIDAGVREAASPDLPAEKIESLLTRLFNGGTIDVSPGIGLWVVLGGAALALLAGIVGLMRRREPTRLPMS